MFDLELEKALKERCDADHQYETLWAQWTFDKKLVAGALNNVVLTFPHYSRHDASHSNTILQQIARGGGPMKQAPCRFFGH